MRRKMHIYRIKILEIFYIFSENKQLNTCFISIYVVTLTELINKNRRQLVEYGNF